MWIHCETNSEFFIETKYCIENDFFTVISSFEYDKKIENPKLIALFYAENDFIKFTIGNYIFENDKYVLKKEYSISYLESNNIDIKKFSHFKLCIDDKILTSYPVCNNDTNIYSDKSIIRAKELLSSVNKKEHNYNTVTYLVNDIKECVKSYTTVQMPFMKKYTWYVISDNNINFNLSSIKYLLSEINEKIKKKSWYLGVSPIDRVFALAIKTSSDKINPFANEDDCTVVYCNEEHNEFYFVVGLILLDDGQYFCLPE